MGDRKLEHCETQRGRNYPEGKEAIFNSLFFNYSSGRLYAEAWRSTDALLLPNRVNVVCRTGVIGSYTSLN